MREASDERLAWGIGVGNEDANTFYMMTCSTVVPRDSEPGRRTGTGGTGAGDERERVGSPTSTPPSSTPTARKTTHAEHEPAVQPLTRQ